jgi:GrpB-like predicted nucleotidyltransferase (UPF0157 family)
LTPLIDAHVNQLLQPAPERDIHPQVRPLFLILIVAPFSSSLSRYKCRFRRIEPLDRSARSLMIPSLPLLRATRDPLMPDPVVVVEYDPSWPSQFERLSARAAHALDEFGLRIEHVGSTAVPGLAAKPVIDLIIQLDDEKQLGPVIQKLEEAGYRHEGDFGVVGREAFAVPAGEARHHLYVCLPGCSQLADQMAFRDYLRTHDDVRDAYAALKRRLADNYRDDRKAYTDGKTKFVSRVMTRTWRRPEHDE